MRIALVHSFYSSRVPSGENAAVEAQARALRRAGHHVALVAARTDDLQRDRFSAVRAGVRVALGGGRSPEADLRSFDPDVVHIHNLFPNWSSGWLAASSWPLVATLHNFRAICSNAMLFRDGAPCTLCPDRTSMSAIRYACYRNSRAATLPLAIASRRPPDQHPVIRAARKVVVLSEVARRLYVRYGVPEDKLAVWPNFVEADGDPGWSAEPGDATWLYAGRLGPEKGIARLVERWPAERHLVVVGDGPERARVERAAQGTRVEVLGLQPRERVRELMRSSIGLVFPSHCFENFPMVYAEAMAAGLPVLAWKPNVVASMVTDQGTGIATTWSEAVGLAVTVASETFPSLRRRCRDVFEELLTEGAYVGRAEALYREVSPEVVDGSRRTRR